MYRAGLLALLVLTLAGCGSRVASTDRSEGPGCGDALAVRDAELQRLDEAHAAALQQRPAARAELDRMHADARRAASAAADLGRCEDGDPSTGVVVDLADLRARIRVVTDRGVTTLRGAPPPRQAGASNGSND